MGFYSEVVSLTFKVVGKSIPRIDGFIKASGEAQYAFDLELPGMLWAKLVRSTIAHGIIKKIDYSEALKVKGVVAVVTGKDLPYKLGIYVGDRDVLAVDKVLWYGQPVVAVIAESLEAAEEAAEKVVIEYESLPAVLDPEETLKPNAPILHPKLGEYRRAPGFNPVPGTNIASKYELKKGDPEKAFKEADIVIENKFKAPMVSHVYLETMNVIAWYHRDGTIEIWSSAQSPFAVRYLMSASLGIPLHKIIIHRPFVGGGFGGKAGLNLEPLVALLSKHAGYKPVRLLLSREENFYIAPVRTGIVAYIKTGARKDGRIIAHESTYIFDSGGYADYAVNVARAAWYKCTGPYDIPNAHCISMAVYTNKVYATAFRGFGHMEFHWAVERQLDILAHELGIDPLEIRLKNALLPGKGILPTGEKLREDAGRLDQCLIEAAKAIDWGKPPEKPKEPWKVRGKGIAALFKGPAEPPNAAASAIVKFNEDGSVDVLVGTTDYGQGTITSLAQIVAEELGLPIEKVHVRFYLDTDANAYTWQTVGSRSTFQDGNAVLMAARDAKRKILEIASQVLHVRPENLELRDEKVCVKGEPWECVSLQEVVFGYTYPNGHAIGGPVIGVGYHIPERRTYLDPTTGRAPDGSPGAPTIFITFGAQAVEIELDLLTGKVEVLRYAGAFDIGKAINPLLVKGQIYGGAVMAMSLGLFEELRYGKDGRLLNPNLTDYKVARAGDIPKEMIPIIIENPQADGPYGARGLAENVMIALPAAIANAIYNAIGVNIYEMPMTPENILKAIKEQKPELIEKAKKALMEYLEKKG